MSASTYDHGPMFKFILAVVGLAKITGYLAISWVAIIAIAYCLPWVLQSLYQSGVVFGWALGLYKNKNAADYER